MKIVRALSRPRSSCYAPATQTRSILIINPGAVAARYGHIRSRILNSRIVRELVFGLDVRAAIATPLLTVPAAAAATLGRRREGLKFRRRRLYCLV